MNTQTEQVAGQAGVLDFVHLIGQFDAIASAMAVRQRRPGLPQVGEGEGARPGMAQPPAVGDGPGRIRFVAIPGLSAGAGFLPEQFRGHEGHLLRGCQRRGGHELVQMAVEVAGVDPAPGHGRMPDQPFQERDVGLGAGDVAARQGVAQAGKRLHPVCAVDDQLGDHRIVEDRHRVAFHNAGVDPHARGRLG